MYERIGRDLEGLRGSTSGEDGGVAGEVDGEEKPDRVVRDDVKTKAVPLLDDELELVFVAVVDKTGLNSSSLSLGGGGDFL